jgi:hypothetical protein
MSHFFKETHPIATLLKRIDGEITALKNTSKVGELKTIEEIIFSVFFNTICREKEAKNGFLIGPVIQMWGNVIHEAISGVRSGVLGTVKGVITELILNDLDIVIETDSLPGSITSSLTTTPTGSRQSSVESNDSMCSFGSFGSVDSFKSAISAVSFDDFRINNSSFSGVSIISTSDQIQIDLTNKTEQIQKIKVHLAQIIPKNPEELNVKWRNMFDNRVVESSVVASSDSQNYECSLKSPIIAGRDAAIAAATGDATETGVDAINLDVPATETGAAENQVPPISSESVIAENKYGVSRIVLSNLETTKYRIHSEKLQAELIEAEKSIDEIIKKMQEPQSDLLIMSVLDWVTTKSLEYFPDTSKEGGYRRRRNVPILAEIKQKIVKTAGLFNAIKPKLVRVKGRKSKRYGPKKGTKKWRKRYGSRRGTKKVYRKRHNTHKKRK